MVEPYAIRAVGRYEACSEDTREEGAAWYPDFRRYCARRGRELGVSTATYAGVFAALSPTNSYAGNLTMAENLLLGKRWNMLRVHRVALDVAEGARPLDVLRGPKVRAFYSAIMERRGHGAVVDRWMARCMGVEQISFTTKRYAELSRALEVGAGQLNVPLHDFQATLWIDIRGSGTP